MTGTFEYEKGDVRSVPDFNVFFRYNATYPYYSDAIWYLTQMRRWGQISDDMPDSWYKAIAAKVYRPDIYMAAAQSLVDDKILSKSDFSDLVGEDGFRDPQKHFIDNIVYDGTQPNAYINKFKIGLKAGDKL
jgi:nitrate/nitrite transport system substrate-binding protein